MANQANIPISSITEERSIFRPIRQGGGLSRDVEIAAEVFSSSASPEAMASAAMDINDLALGCRLATAIAQEKGARTEKAVYVISGLVANVSKIGVTGNPTCRLREIQVSHWDRLSIKALFWIYGPEHVIETRALELAEAAGLRITGEWVGAPPTDAANMVASAVSASNIPVASSAMWIRNRAKMLKARAEATDPSNIGDEFAGGPIKRMIFGDDLLRHF